MSHKSRRSLLILAVLGLTAGGAALRLHELGTLGFFGDEETTAFAARSLAEGRGSAMPSGMPYRRALPYTWLNAVSARASGLDSELGYRVPAALIGAATIPLIYLVTAAIAGPGAGLIAALLLATSGWHLVWSRTARMYVPALFTALAFFWVAWRWQRSGRRLELGVAAVLYVLSVFLHSGTAAIVLFPILFALLYDGDRVSVRSATLAAGTMAIGGWLLDRVFVVAPYEQWATGFSAVSSAPAGQLAGSLSELLYGTPAAGWLLIPVGFGVGWMWARSAGVFEAGRNRQRAVVTALLAALSVSSGYAGLPWVAFSLAIAVLLLDARGGHRWWRPAWVVTGLAGSALGAAGRTSGSTSGLAELVRNPFPYLPYLATLLPLFTVLFAVCLAWLALAPAAAPETEPDRASRPQGDDRPVRAAALFVLAYCLALGFAIAWAPWRYLLIVYPWLVLVVAVGIAAGLKGLTARLPRRPAGLAYASATALILAGAVGGHGLPASRTVVQARPGSTVPWNDPDMVVRPDHRSLGRFVARQAGPRDIVIAEDALEQRWYTGRVDYWFRSERDAGRYLYRDANGAWRDIYVGAELLADPPPPSLLDRGDRAAWLLTSGETAGARGWYLDSAQSAWLARVERTREPVHRGEDGLSAVYCFGSCP